MNNVKIFGRLMKIQQEKATVGSETFGTIELENKKKLDIIVESDTITNFFNSVEPGNYYFMEGEITEMDDELWETFERNYPWKRPKDILFVMKFSDGSKAADI